MKKSMKEWLKRKKSSKKRIVVQMDRERATTTTLMPQILLIFLSLSRCCRRWTSLVMRLSRTRKETKIVSKCSRQSQLNKMHSFSSISISKRRQTAVVAIWILKKDKKISKLTTATSAMKMQIPIEIMAIIMVVTMARVLILMELVIEKKRDSILRTIESILRKIW